MSTVFFQKAFFLILKENSYFVNILQDKIVIN